jgi:hypothetical protein
LGAGGWVGVCGDLVVGGARRKGRGRKAWRECVSGGMGRMGLGGCDAQDRTMWRNGVLGNVQPALALKKRTLN